MIRKVIGIGPVYRLDVPGIDQIDEPESAVHGFRA